jgi:two-component system NtrC family sensor kinase
MTERAGAQRGEPGVPVPTGAPVHDVLVAVPFRHRLSTKLLGMSALLALAALAVLWFAERRMQRDLEDQLAGSTALLADALQVGTQRALLDARPAHVYGAMDLIGRLDGVERVQVLNKGGRVVFSTDPRDVGTTIAKSGRSCQACHGDREQPLSRAPATARAEVIAAGEGRALALLSAIYNDRSCSTADCHVHPPGRQVLGLLELRVSLGHLDAKVAAFRRGFVMVLSAAVLLLAALMYLFGRAEIVEPVAALVEGTRRVARDELDVEIRVASRGELGVLARSFNEMTRALRRLEDDLTGVMDGLEREVEARTADLRAAQESLVRTEKLSSLGQLSASIAHEINNPLAGILTFAKLVSRILAEGPPDDARRATLQRNLALIERESQRCSAIVRNLLDFARERPIMPKPLDPRAPLEEALSLVAHKAETAGIYVEKGLDEVPEVVADFGQLRQAFVNILMNAIEAMGSSGGKLRITCGRVGEVVEVRISDTGPGIPPERLTHIFDPFFTTKEKGTGLGLSVVFGIIDRHGGEVVVDSTVGVGTLFNVRLPVATALGMGADVPTGTLG